MESQQIDCPLCCDKTFDSKQLLFDHLNNVMDNIYCPLCNSKWPTLEGLTEHLSLYDCQAVQNDTVQNIVIYEQGIHVENLENSEDIKDNDIKPLTNVTELNTADSGTQYIMSESYECQDGTEVNKMYVDLMTGKQISKCGNDTELKLIKNEGENCYMIVTQDSGELQSDNTTTIVTKQNDDGTISLTAVKEPKEADALIAPELAAGDSQVATYSCNACKVSFTSVMDHIENYHSDQEVVLEDIATPEDQNEVSMAYNTMETEEESVSNDKLVPRRVITDTGDIVEEPVVLKTESTEVSPETLEADGFYHKVMIKEVQTKTGFAVKMYHCMSCNVTVNNLDEFQTRPCKTMKYPCPRCTAVYENSKSLCAHMKVHKQRPDDKLIAAVSHECEICCTEFPTAKSLKLHKRMHEPKSRAPVEIKDSTQVLYRCNICELTVPFDQRSIHDNSHKTGDNTSCGVCNKKFSSIEYLNMHMKTHNGEKVTVEKQDKSFIIYSKKMMVPNEKIKTERMSTDGKPQEPVTYECEVCCTVFSSNKSLKLHKRMHDPVKSRPIELPVENTSKDGTQTLYRCNICEKMIPFDYRTIHENSHKTSDRMNCGICNKKFTSIEYLEMHMNVHNLDKVPVNKQDKSLPYKCLYCNRRFARPHEKVKHERIHTGEKPHSCEICGKSFRVSYCLTLHMRTHTGARPYACPHCGKRFKAHSVYNHHLLTHSEVRAYKCPYCPKAFKTSVQLAGHKNSHTKPFSCQHCNRPFASLYAVRVHTETHSRLNNLKFSCALCGASYARAFALKDHVKDVHSKDQDIAEKLLENTQDEEWMSRDNTTDAETLNKELQQDINEFEMNTNELIVP